MGDVWEYPPPPGPPNIRIFPFLQEFVQLISQQIEIHASAYTQLSIFSLRGFNLSGYSHKNKLGVRAFQATKCKKYMAGKFTRAAHLWREITQIEFRVKRWHKKYEILNQIESHNFGLNYVLIKSNRTALQTYKVEERTFGTPCSSVRVGTQGLFCPYLKTFVPPFLPTRLTAPGSARMVQWV